MKTTRTMDARMTKVSSAHLMLAPPVSMLAPMLTSTRTWTCVLTLTLSLVSPISFTARAQATPHNSWTQLTVRSTKLGDSRTIYVATPSGYATSTARYPVLVLLDANDEPQFTSAVANVAFLASRSAIPQLIIVGIPNGKDRTHDLTPTATGEALKTFPTAGGAAALTDFIADEALPLIRSKYRTLPSTVLAGHSFGGLFAMHVAATKPGVFTGIVAMSASLWWNDSTSALAYADSIAKSPATARLFATSGEFEPPIAITVKRFATHLDSIKPASLAFGHQHYADDTHGLTPVPSLMDGLRFVFEPVSLVLAPNAILAPEADSAAVVAAFTTAEDSYARGARGLGMPEHLPDQFVNSFGNALIAQPKLRGAAVWMLRRNTANYPESPGAFDRLGDGLLALGDSSAARIQFRHAADLSARAGKPANEETKKKLAALEHVASAGARTPK